MYPLLIVLLVLAAVGGLPAFHAHSLGYGPSGVASLLVIVLVILLLTGRL
jgi:hypothetical protein